MEYETKAKCPNCGGRLILGRKSIWVVEFSPVGTELRSPATHNVYRCSSCNSDVVFLAK